MERISKRKAIEIFMRLILLGLFLALTALKVHDLLVEETGISLQTKKIDVEIPTVSICFGTENIAMDKFEEMLPSRFIESTTFTIQSVKNGLATYEIKHEDWGQFFYSSYKAVTQMVPCFYLDSPISTVQPPDYVKVGYFNNYFVSIEIYHNGNHF